MTIRLEQARTASTVLRSRRAFRNPACIRLAGQDTSGERGHRTATKGHFIPRPRSILTLYCRMPGKPGPVPQPVCVVQHRTLIASAWCAVRRGDSEVLGYTICSIPPRAWDTHQTCRLAAYHAYMVAHRRMFEPLMGMGRSTQAHSALLAEQDTTTGMTMLRTPLSGSRVSREPLCTCV